jgi:gluconate 2-dehydrogenase gamma chain
VGFGLFVMKDVTVSSEKAHMDTMNRRSLLKLLSSAPVAAGFALTEAEAQQAHHAAQEARQAAKQAGTAYKPKFFTPHEYETVKVLCDLIIPADDRSGGATAAGVPEFMDFTMVDQPGRQVAMRGGLAWLDLECQRRFDKPFTAASESQRTNVLDDLSTYLTLKPGLTHGQAFFRSFRDLTASGFWTSKMGIQDLGYMGNTAVPQWNGCPQEALEKLGL